MGRKILVCEFDIFSAVGGGQTVYQNIIRRCPDDTFYYFITGENLESNRPANAIGLPFRQFYTLIANVPRAQDHFFHVYRESMDMAHSVLDVLGETQFDVADTPDYRQNGLFLRNALEAHGISVGIVALALHGTLTSALTMGWPWSDDPARLFAQLRLRERLQFRVVDARYAISQFYADELQRSAQFPINMLDPLAIIRDTKLSLPEHEDRAADLLFIGRRERRKGPDLFIDLAWWLPPGAFRRVIFIGGEGTNHQGLGSRDIVDGIARRRRLKPEFIPPVSQLELQQFIHQKSLVLITSRYDQFNLIALEALLDGCPTVISQHTGIAQFVRQRIPELSWLITDIACDRSAAIPAREILEDYDGRRAKIVDILQRAELVPDFDSLQRLYLPANTSDQQAQATIHDLADRFEMFSLRGTVWRTPLLRTALTQAMKKESAVSNLTRAGIGSAPPLENQTPAARSISPLRIEFVRDAYERARRAARFSRKVARYSRNMLTSPRATARSIGRQWVAKRGVKLLGLSDTAIQQLSQLTFSSEISRNLIEFGERSNKEREGKLRYLNDLVSGRKLDRVRFFREMIRLERARGNNLIAATYGLRLLRWLGSDRFHLLDFVQETLRKQGFAREAEAAGAMFGAPEKAEELSRALLDEQLRRHRSNPDRPWQLIEDRRGQKDYRVSIIVSLYNAADKLPAFWRMLSQQSSIRSGEAEVVFVDSGSPSDERAVFQRLSAENPLPAVYARSPGRETIQMAWNRGVNLSSGEYLAFLGVDEGIHPDCLDVLAQELDQDPSIDWVMADSVVTEVDRAGIFSRDIMSYDRTGYRQDWHYLDCTFLSYVGGLYRRNIHDRFGYYDETFRAAGDTEFKNRILPHIRTKYVPRVLAVFNNYPEERTTQHPRAEIEDLRAWYLHRTPAGVSYAFDNRPAQDVVDLLKDTLSYRKCYCQHLSTDIDLADSLAAYLGKRFGGAKWQAMRSDVREILREFQKFEQLHYSDRVERDQIAWVQNYRKIQRVARGVAQAVGTSRPHAFDVFHDNRYEQHWWAWDTWSK